MNGHMNTRFLGGKWNVVSQHCGAQEQENIATEAAESPLSDQAEMPKNTS